MLAPGTAEASDSPSVFIGGYQTSQKRPLRAVETFPTVQRQDFAILTGSTEQSQGLRSRFYTHMKQNLQMDVWLPTPRRDALTDPRSDGLHKPVGPLYKGVPVETHIQQELRPVKEILRPQARSQRATHYTHSRRGVFHGVWGDQSREIPSGYKYPKEGYNAWRSICCCWFEDKEFTTSRRTRKSASVCDGKKHKPRAAPLDGTFLPLSTEEEARRPQT